MSGYLKPASSGCRIFVEATFLFMVLSSPAGGQLRFSGDLAVLTKTLDENLTENRNFRGDDPFNELRLRLFLRHWVDDKTAFIGELLMDNGAAVRVNGAYVVMRDLFSLPWINLKGGLIPSPFGNYGLRSTYFGSNPLVGVPLMWHYRSALDAGRVQNNSELLADKEMFAGGYNPIAYDACWDLGWELFGEVGKIEYSLALTEGTLSSPRARSNDGRQLIAKLGINPWEGARSGIAWARGAYLLSSALDITAGDAGIKRVEDYLATVIGWYAEYAAGYWQLFSEFIRSTWDTPLILEKELTASSGYLEGRYDLLPRVYLAARFDAILYSDITDEATGSKTPWDYRIERLETGIGYRLSRESRVKVIYQRNTYPERTTENSEILALQYHLVF